MDERKKVAAAAVTRLAEIANEATELLAKCMELQIPSKSLAHMIAFADVTRQQLHAFAVAP